MPVGNRCVTSLPVSSGILARLMPVASPSSFDPAGAGGLLLGVLVLCIGLGVLIGWLAGGWSLAGWGLAAVLWVAVHAIDLLLRRAKPQTGNVVASGVQAFGLFFKSIGLLVVLIAALAAS